MTRPKVLLTNPIGREGIELLQSVADVVIAPDVKPQTLLDGARDADAILVRANLPPNIFEMATRLRGVVRYAVGLDMIPVETATANAIPVANMPGVNAESVAEYVISALLLLTRRMHLINHTLRTKDWNSARALGEKSTELMGRTLGVIGLGNIGSRVAEICHAGFRMKLLGHQRRLNAVPTFVKGVDIDTLCRESDFIAMCCPLTDATRNLLNKDRIALMKSTAGIVNVSRGPVWDEMAIAAALREERLGGAVCDVYAEQPLRRDHPFLALDNMVLTAHMGGLTQESMRRLSIGSAQEVLRLLRNEKPVNFVNPQVWEKHLQRIRNFPVYQFS
ncbi:MAG: hydroxyacid dehydrogenase [Betaproteobacteria bacterium]|nr:hydroxyacid dehydrogenase [Betaproteobacteria bacterium]